MNEYAAADGGVRPTPGQGPTARTVEITSILQRSADTYQVRWVETTYGGGLRRSRESYAGLFQVRLIPPRDEADAFRNPIGAYVTSFTWSREFAGPVNRDEASPARPADAGPTNRRGYPRHEPIQAVHQQHLPAGGAGRGRVRVVRHADGPGPAR